MIQPRSYCIITADQLAAHPKLHERPEVMLTAPETATPLPGGDFIVGLRGIGTDPDEVTADGLENVDPAVLAAITGAPMSKRRAHALVLGRRLYHEYSVGKADGDYETELLAKAAAEGVDVSGLTLKSDIVRAFLRDAEDRAEVARDAKILAEMDAGVPLELQSKPYVRILTPKQTAAEALAWADGKATGEFKTLAKARGLGADHAPDKATAVDWLLGSEGY